MTAKQQYEPKHRIARMVRSLSVRARVSIVVGTVVAAGIGTAVAVGSASAATSTTTTAAVGGSPVVACVNGARARPYSYVPWRGLWMTYTGARGSSLKCPSGSWEASMASTAQLNHVWDVLQSNVSATTANAAGVAANKAATSSNTAAITALKPVVTNLVTTPQSVTTGGSFTSRASLLKTTVPLTEGTYMVSVSFKATPDAVTTGTVFPQMMVYNGPVNSSFTNNLFNVGSGALELPTNAEVSNSDLIDSYYSGVNVVTVPAGGETLDFYAFGYDSDTGSGSYTLDSASVTAVRLAS